MILTLLCLFHEYVAKTLIPYYKLKFEAFEAANRLIECWETEILDPNVRTALDGS